MSKGGARLFVTYCAKDFLDGTQMLSPWEELAYRRICDLIYTTGDRLPDDDKKLAWMTKTGRRWPAIKAALTTGDKPKLAIIEGRITNARCQTELQKAAQKIEQKRRAAAASVASGKSLNNLKHARTDVRDGVEAGDVAHGDDISAQKRAAVGGVTPTPSIVANQLKTLEPQRTSVREPVRLPVSNELLNQESKEEEGESPPKPPPGRWRERAEDPEFDLWYAGYPHKVCRGAAERAWPQARQLASLDELRTGLERYKHDKPPDRQWCNPASWLNGKRWLDEPAVAERDSGNGQRRLSPVEKLYAGADLAWREYERRKGNGGDCFENDVALLDRRRSH